MAATHSLWPGLSAKALTYRFEPPQAAPVLAGNPEPVSGSYNREFM
jgi:hypothetical protein